MTATLDITPMLQAESDELVADSLVGGPITFTITDADMNGQEKKKLRLFYDGCNNRPWRPCKGMARILAAQWGPDAKRYIGRAVTVYRDPDAMYGGAKLGGVRLSAMSDIPGPFETSVKEGRGKLKVFKIGKINAEPPANPANDPAEKWTTAFVAKVKACTDSAALTDLVGSSDKRLSELAEKRPELRAEIDRVVAECGAFLSAADAGVSADADDDGLGW